MNSITQTTPVSSAPAALPPLTTCTVAVIGLGYVGLPLAVEFAKAQQCVRSGVALNRQVIGFDINAQRLAELREVHDRTRETNQQELQTATALQLTSDPAQMAAADVFIVTVPTPIDNAKRPDLTPLEKASASVGRALKARAAQGATTSTTPVVIYESTVYPDATEEVCVPILERKSGLRFNTDFFCGYSPERINPGDTEPNSPQSSRSPVAAQPPLLIGWMLSMAQSSKPAPIRPRA